TSVECLAAGSARRPGLRRFLPLRQGAPRPAHGRPPGAALPRLWAGGLRPAAEQLPAAGSAPGPRPQAPADAVAARRRAAGPHAGRRLAGDGARLWFGPLAASGGAGGAACSERDAASALAETDRAGRERPPRRRPAPGSRDARQGRPPARPRPGPTDR